MTQDPLTSTPSTSPTMIRSEERLDLHTERVAVDRVRVRRRIVTEERIVRVQVRREELVLESAARGDGPAAGTGPDGLAVGAGPLGDRLGGGEPLVIVLRQEVPDVVLHTEAYERVTVTKQTVTGNQQVRAELRREVVELERDVTGTADPHPV